MKTIKTYISNLPKSIKVLLLINIIVNFIFIMCDYFFTYNLNYTFGVYPTCSENFKVFQILTFMFSHDVNPLHVISNLVFLLLFATAVSRVIGDKNTIKLYIFSGLISFLSFNHEMNNQNSEISDKLTKAGIDIKKIKQEREGGYIEMSTFNNTNKKQKMLLDLYPVTNSCLYGASGSIFAFMVIYPFFFIKRKKSILLNLIVLLYVIQLIIMVINHNIYTLSTTFGHLGGVIGGIIFLIVWLVYLKNKK